MAGGRFTAAEWDDYIRKNFGTIPEAEKWRNENNVFVDGLPDPTYTGPLSSGGSVGVKPQGMTSMDPEDQIEEGALPGLAAAPYKNLDQWSAAGTGMSQAQADWNAKQESARAAQYEAMRKALNERRFGPSRAEQLFALSAAIGKPMIRPSFGGVMSNVTSTLADIEKANREAQTSRAEALAALEQSLLNQTDAAKQAEFKAQREAWAAQGPVLAQLAKPKSRRTGFNPLTGALVDMDTGQPVEQANLPVLSPEQVAAASRDPSKRGMRFQTVDGRVMEIK
jgi:hypothetical protein